MEKTKGAYQKKAEAQLREIEARIAVLKARAEKSTADAQIKYNRQIDEMQYEYGRLKARFKEFIESSQDAWEELQTGLDEAIDDLKETVESAADMITK